MANLQNTVHSTLGEPLTITGDSIDGAALVTLEAHMPEGLLDLSPTVARQLSALLLEAALAAEAHLAIGQAA